jgi:ATP phosphoribosyltransferase
VNSAREYFKRNNTKVEIVPLSGAVEIAPVIGLADVIVDLTSTGSTLKTHNLRVVDTILESQTVLIGNKDCSGELLDDLLLALQGVVSAEKKKYLMANMPEDKLAELERTSKGALSPTVTKLDKPGWIAVQMVVEEKGIFDLIKKLKAIGGRDVLVLDIERLVK